MKWLKGKKTYIVAILMGVISLLDVITGTISIGDFIASGQVQSLLAAFGLSTLRAGVEKNK